MRNTRYRTADEYSQQTKQADEAGRTAMNKQMRKHIGHSSTQQESAKSGDRSRGGSVVSTSRSADARRNPRGRRSDIARPR